MTHRYRRRQLRSLRSQRRRYAALFTQPDVIVHDSPVCPAAVPFPTDTEQDPAVTTSDTPPTEIISAGQVNVGDLLAYPDGVKEVSGIVTGARLSSYEHRLVIYYTDGTAHYGDNNQTAYRLTDRPASVDMAAV
jgi:hypothetical protein